MVRRRPDVPLAAELARYWAHWNSPAAKLQRRRQRTSRALTLWIVVTLLFGLAGAAGAYPLLAGVVIFGALGVRSAMRLRQLNRVRPAELTPALPASTSAAFAPMQRLAKAEASLAELLVQLTGGHGGLGIDELSLEQARTTASDAVTALRSLATKIEAIERARESAPERERPALDSAVQRLVEQVEDGIDGYGTLVAAAGKAVAATAPGVDSAQRSMTDATDRLAGMAIALRELGR